MDNSAKNINIRVCILNWNGGETLNRCIDSLFQNTDQDFSITIIDNGSTDGSLDNVKSSIEVIKLDKNHGYSKGYNLGIEKIRDNDEYIVLLNYDTSVSSNFISSLSNQIKIMRKLILLIAFNLMMSHSLIAQTFSYQAIIYIAF